MAPTTQVSFTICVPFTTCITKIDETTVDNAKNLRFGHPMYNLIEYGTNHSYTISSLWFYSKDEASNFDDNKYWLF